VVATAIVYWRRYYLNNSFVDQEPTLMAGTCVYLASKVEECSMKVDSIVKSMNTEKDLNLPFKFTEYQNSDIIQCEFYLMDGLKCHLLIFHPYTELHAYLADAGLMDCKEDARRFINDTYRTDVNMIYPPHIIVLGCIYLTGFSEKEVNYARQNKIATWFAELNVDLDKVGEVVQEVLGLYEIWGNDVVFSKEISVILTRKLPQLVNSSAITNTSSAGNCSTNAIVILDK